MAINNLHIWKKCFYTLKIELAEQESLEEMFKVQGNRYNDTVQWIKMRL